MRRKAGKYNWGRDAFRKGTTNTVCDISGFKVKSNQVRRMWNGLYVIPEEWNPRDPQDFPAEIKPQKVYKNARPPKVNTVTAPTIENI